MSTSAIEEVDFKEYLKQIENKLSQLSFNPSNTEAIRFCVSHLILRAIALSKDPNTSSTRIRDLFDICFEILAIGDLKTDVEDGRMRDLINAMVEKDDLGLALKAAIKEQRERMDLLVKDTTYHFSIAKEERESIAADVSSIRQNTQKLTNKGSTLRMFLVILLCLSFLYVSAISTGVVIAYVMSTTSQLDTPIDKSRTGYKPIENNK